MFDVQAGGSTDGRDMKSLDAMPTDGERGLLIQRNGHDTKLSWHR